MSRLIIELSVDDLDKIIKSDLSTSIKIKNYIIQEFAKKHLKPIVNDEIFNKVKDDILREVEDNLLTIVGEKSSKYSSKRILNATLMEQIKDSVNETIRNKIYLLIKESIEEFMSDEKYIDEFIDKKIQFYFTNTLNTRFNSKLKTINSKINEIFKEIDE